MMWEKPELNELNVELTANGWAPSNFERWVNTNDSLTPEPDPERTES